MYSKKWEKRSQKKIMLTTKLYMNHSKIKIILKLNFSNLKSLRDRYRNKCSKVNVLKQKKKTEILLHKL